MYDSYAKCAEEITSCFLRYALCSRQSRPLANPGTTSTAVRVAPNRLFVTRRFAQRGLCRRVVSVRLSVCHVCVSKRVNVLYSQTLTSCRRTTILQCVHKKKQSKARRALGRAHVPPTKVFPRLAVNKTILKPRLAVVTDRANTHMWECPYVIKFRVAARTISEKAIRFQHPDRAQKLMS